MSVLPYIPEWYGSQYRADRIGRCAILPPVECIPHVEPAPESVYDRSSANHHAAEKRNATRARNRALRDRGIVLTRVRGRYAEKHFRGYAPFDEACMGRTIGEYVRPVGTSAIPYWCYHVLHVMARSNAIKLAKRRAESGAEEVSIVRPDSVYDGTDATRIKSARIRSRMIQQDTEEGFGHSVVMLHRMFERIIVRDRVEHRKHPLATWSMRALLSWCSKVGRKILSDQIRGGRNRERTIKAPGIAWSGKLETVIEDGRIVRYHEIEDAPKYVRVRPVVRRHQRFSYLLPDGSRVESADRSNDPLHRLIVEETLLRTLKAMGFATAEAYQRVKLHTQEKARRKDRAYKAMLE